MDRVSRAKYLLGAIVFDSDFSMNGKKAVRKTVKRKGKTHTQVYWVKESGDQAKVKKLEGLLNTMDNMDYGFIDKNGKIYTEEELSSEEWMKEYRVQTGDRLSKTGIGHCWDFVELERDFCKKNDIPCKSFFVGDPDLEITHTFLTCSVGKDTYYLESALYKNKGLYKFSSQEECNNYVKKMMENSYGFDDVRVVEYSEPKRDTDQIEFMKPIIDKIQRSSITNQRSSP
jgi:hypothetical protein